MMQDFPKLLGPGDKVGFADFERWFSFSPVKNSIAEAVASHQNGVYAASPGAGEEAVYEAHRRLLGLAGVAIAPPAPPVEHLGLPLSLFPAVALSPRFALTVDQLMSNVPGGAAVSVSATSTLWLDGHVTLHSLALDGALVIRAAPGTRVHVRDCTVTNGGWTAEPVAEDPTDKFAIRGYTMKQRDGLVLDVTEPGEYELSGDGVLTRLGELKSEL